MKMKYLIAMIAACVTQTSVFALTHLNDQAQLTVQWSDKNVNTLQVQGEKIDQIIGNTSQYSARIDTTGQLYISLAPTLNEPFSIFFKTDHAHHFSVLVNPNETQKGGATTCVSFKKVSRKKARPRVTFKGQPKSILNQFKKGVVPKGAHAIKSAIKKPTHLLKGVVMIPERRWQIGHQRIQVFKLVNNSRHPFTFESKRFHDPKGLKMITQKHTLQPHGDWTWGFELMKG